jgi:hypothetical protein
LKKVPDYAPHEAEIRAKKEAAEAAPSNRLLYNGFTKRFA